MKIALVVPGGVDRSGTERVIPCLLWLVERLARAHEVHVFALQQEDRPDSWPLLGAHVHNAGSRPRRLRSVLQLSAEHRRGRFDVVHAFWAGAPGTVAAAFKSMTGVPLVVTVAGGDLSALRDIGYGARLNLRGRAWTRLSLAHAHRVIVPSRWLAKQAAELGVEAEVIPWGVALDQWPAAPPRRRIQGEPLRLIQVANLNAVKDQRTLLEAVRLLVERGLDFTLDLIGFDALGGKVQRLSAELGLEERIRFHGFMPHPQIRPLVEAADLLVVSSRHEAGPMVFLEAAVAGVPTVGTAVGWIADHAGRAAIAVQAGDGAALADAIAQLDSDENRRLELARAAQEIALANDADAFAARIEGLYRELAALRGR